MPTVVSMAYFFICLPPHVAPKPGNFFLLMFCRVYDGIYFHNRLPLGYSGQDGKFDAHLRSRLFASSSPNTSNSLLLEIIDKILHHAFSLSQIRIGEHRNKFVGMAAGGKAPYGTKVFIDIYAHTAYGLLCRFVAQACNDGIHLLQSKNHNRASFPKCFLLQLNMIQNFELPFGVEAR